MDVNRINAAINSTPAATNGSGQAGTSIGDKLSAAFANMLNFNNLTQSMGSTALLRNPAEAPLPITPRQESSAPRDDAPRAEAADRRDNAPAKSDKRDDSRADAAHRDASRADTDTSDAKPSNANESKAETPRDNSDAKADDTADANDRNEAQTEADTDTVDEAQAVGNADVTEAALNPMAEAQDSEEIVAAATQASTVAQNDTNQRRDGSHDVRNQTANQAVNKPTEVTANKPEFAADARQDAAARDMASNRAKSDAAAAARAQNQNAAAVNDAGDALEAQTLLREQRADLNQRVNSDRPVTVKVNVDNQNAQVQSQSMANLNASAVAAEAVARTPADGKAKVSLTPTTQPQQNATPNQNAFVNAMNPNAAAAEAAFQATEAAATRAAGPAAAQAATPSTAPTTATTTAAPTTASAQQSAATHKPTEVRPHQQPEMPRKVAQQISVNITKAMSQGSDKISIQLRPAELGRIDVQLDVSKTGRVSASIVVERAETLDMLKSDVRSLEKALRDAGLDTDAGELNYNLRGESGDNGEQTAAGNRYGGMGTAAPEDDTLEQELRELTSPNSERNVVTDDRIDVRV